MIVQEVLVAICIEKGKSMRGTAVRAAEKAWSFAKAAGAEASRSLPVNSSCTL